MFKNLITILVLILGTSAYAFQCPQNHSDESVFSNAEAVYVIRINSVEFYKDIEGGKDAKLLFVKYEVQETLKGKKQNEGEVTDLAGIGTGFVNFIPGTYYIIALSEKPAELDKNHINFCDVLGMAFHLGDGELKQKIET